MNETSLPHYTLAIKNYQQYNMHVKHVIYYSLITLLLYIRPSHTFICCLYVTDYNASQYLDTIISEWTERIGCIVIEISIYMNFHRLRRVNNHKLINGGYQITAEPLSIMVLYYRSLLQYSNNLYPLQFNCEDQRSNH